MVDLPGVDMRYEVEEIGLLKTITGRSERKASRTVDMLYGVFTNCLC